MATRTYTATQRSHPNSIVGFESMQKNKVIGRVFDAADGAITVDFTGADADQCLHALNDDEDDVEQANVSNIRFANLVFIQNQDVEDGIAVDIDGIAGFSMENGLVFLPTGGGFFQTINFDMNLALTVTPVSAVGKFSVLVLL